MTLRVHSDAAVCRNIHANQCDLIKERPTGKPLEAGMTISLGMFINPFWQNIPSP
jgi:hypothetical protein